MPRHINPTRPERTATAPYNFVPLPERVFVVENGIEVDGRKIKPWEMHDRYVPGTYSGWIDLEIETLTPLYIRSAVTRDANGDWNTREARLRPDPYSFPDGTPAIPGSSLRGMVRTLVEILSFSKIQSVSEGKPFFRDISPSRISTEYRRHFIEDLGLIRAGIDIASGEKVSKPAQGYRTRVRAGFLKLPNRAICECDFARIERQLINQAFNSQVLSGSGPMATPNWTLQHSGIWVQVDPTEQDYFFCRKTTPNGRQRHPDLYLRFRKANAASASQRAGYEGGTLVITGGIPNKHLEFVFLAPPENGLTIPVPDEIWERFHDEDQITQWQERAFPRDEPTRGSRRANGHLRDGEPVFFLTDDAGKLVFLGRAQMFRFPYDLGPADLIPEDLRTAGLDLAEAMFGTVDRNRTIKGRVQFQDALATKGGPDWYEPVLVPQILSAPKPTTFQHYLTQDGTKGKDQLTTYLQGDHTTIRGHKLYWHRWDDTSGVSQVKEAGNHDALLSDLQQQSPNDTQHTIIRPVKAGVVFAGRVRFENLTDLELGALLSALQLPDGCCHRLGMGKPLGLGSVRITTRRLSLLDRKRRYVAWKRSDVVAGEDGSRFRTAFERAILKHARASRETLLSSQQDLRQIARLDALYQLLSWSNRPPPQSTRYMDLGRFRQRPVLSTPHAVAGVSEPSWSSDPPRPGNRGGTRAGPSQAPRQSSQGQAARPAPATPPRPAQKPVETGQTRRGTLKRSGGAWVAVFEGDSREASIVNPNSLPHDCAEGTAAEFYITEQSKRGGIKARFERMV